MNEPLEHGVHASIKNVLVRVAGQLYGVPAHLVSEMIQVPDLTPIAMTDPVMRGAFMLRGETVMVVDLRRVMGEETLADEIGAFREMLQAREQDHRNWLTELEKSVLEERPFTLATDPHKCAFGKWYDVFESDSVIIQNHLAKFDAPHKRIHALAIEVGKLVAAGRVEDALARIEATRDFELAEMISLFAQFSELLDATVKEIAVVLQGPRGRKFAYSVDEVEGVQDVRLEAGARETVSYDIPALERHGLYPAFVGAKREVALLMNPENMPGIAELVRMAG